VTFDWIAANIGRWAFVIGQTVLIVAWMVSNGVGSDPFPWIFLNLMLSLQAAYTGPVLLISANRADAMRTRLMRTINGHTATTEKHMRETHAAITEMRADYRAVMARFDSLDEAVKRLRHAQVGRQ
jgi:uncharacterized membrane protein